MYSYYPQYNIIWTGLYIKNVIQGVPKNQAEFIVSNFDGQAKIIKHVHILGRKDLKDINIGDRVRFTKYEFSLLNEEGIIAERNRDFVYVDYNDSIIVFQLGFPGMIYKLKK